MTAVIDHVAFVVESLETALAGLETLQLRPQVIDSFPAEGTRECYLGAPGQRARILLMEPIGDGPYERALRERGPGLHHVALNVPSIERFLEQIDGSGWLLHPRSFATRPTIWLARPGVEALIEVHETSENPRTMGYVQRVVLAGLDVKPGLIDLFAKTRIEVVPGPRSGVVVAGRLVCSPEHFDAPDIGDPFEYNREAWNRNVRQGNRWTIPVSPDEVQRARKGTVEVLLTPTRFVPTEWLGELLGADVLCLASGGGQQGPLLAAAGARVTVFDASDEQLARDRVVASREGLEIRTVQGDMRDLSALPDESFDLVFHPCSNSFVEAVEPVWREAYRVLRTGGHLISGFSNPVMHCFDWGSVERKRPQLRYRLPYRDIDHLDDPFVAKVVADGEPVEFSHTLTAQIGGQIAAGFAIVGFFEDRWGSDELFPDAYFDGFIATRSVK